MKTEQSTLIHGAASDLTVADLTHALMQMQTEGTVSQAHERMVAVSRVLEENPALAQLAISGLQSLKAAAIVSAPAQSAPPTPQPLSAPQVSETSS